MKGKPNTLNRIVSQLNRLPAPVRSSALTLFFGRTVRFTGTSGIKVISLTESKCEIILKNRKPVQNHIGFVHAVATALIAESVTGFLVGMNVPDNGVPVIKTIKADYVKRASGDMRAIATLSESQQEQIRITPKGELAVPVVVTDGAGREPVLFEMIWAWTPRRNS